MHVTYGNGIVAHVITNAIQLDRFSSLLNVYDRQVMVARFTFH